MACSITFTVRAARCTCSASVPLDGVRPVPPAELEGLSSWRPGSRSSTPASPRSRPPSPSYYRVRGFAAVRVAPRLDLRRVRRWPRAGRRALRDRRGAAHRGDRGARSRASRRSRRPSCSSRWRSRPASPTTVRSRPSIARPSSAAIAISATNAPPSRRARRRRPTAPPWRSPTWCAKARRRASTTCSSAAPPAPRRSWCGASSRSQPGSPLGFDAIIESQQRLSALGLFRRVRITEAPHGTDDSRRDVLVEVEEAPSTSLSYGGGLEVGQRDASHRGRHRDRPCSTSRLAASSRSPGATCGARTARSACSRR